MAQQPHGPLRSYGRTRGRPIRTARAGRLDSLLPELRLDPAAGGIDVRALAAALGSAGGAAWLEIGFGAGEHLAAQAQRHPDILMLGAEPFLNGVASALAHIETRGLKNVRLYPGDARDLLAALPDAMLDRVLILFPDPWPKLRHHKRRLIQPSFVAETVRVLRPGGRLRFATDWADYADEALGRLIASPRLVWTAQRADDWRKPPPDHVATRYEAKRLGDIAPVFFDLERTT